ncbi:uncharacterized protein ARMOST_03195 [Armillaria ostoyae]|uniref:Integrase catalytic domain-containing protein n=1 Tax=Armillaria ostoyae TaxID=47428 RepID=A0A284QTS3_ARMOS|nr:uncharacterized protein ARMOST_03195 [Armillaria ostoyae]
MDFIEQLLDSNGFTAILVVIDHASKQAIFIPTHDTINSEELTWLFVIHIFSKHGIPNHITSDHSSEFVSQFTYALAKALDMELHFASRYHLEADGQTECATKLWNSTSFAYNNALNTSTRISPFFANKGYYPNITVHPECDIASTQACSVSLQDPSRQTLKSGSSLQKKFLGPFEIIAQLGSHSFTLKLPSDLHVIHPVFHISQLKPVEENTIPNCVQPPLPLVEVDGEEQYKIAQILDSKIDHLFQCPLLYRIQWLKYKKTNEKFAWLPATKFSTNEFIEEFHRRYPDKPGPIAKVTI